MTFDAGMSARNLAVLLYDLGVITYDMGDKLIDTLNDRYKHENNE